MSDDTKVCATCGGEYDAAYDGCPRCARKRERGKSCLAAVVTIAVILILGCCGMELLFG